MTQAAGGRPCPGCGAVVGSQYCPHCGAKVIGAKVIGAEAIGTEAVDPAGTTVQSGPVWSGNYAASIPGADTPTVPSLPVVPKTDGPVAATPQMFATEMVPIASAGQPLAWSQASESVGPQTGLFPGWTGMYPAVSTEGGQGQLAPRPERRRKALYAVLGIVAVTVIVLVAALLITPHLGTSGKAAEKDGQPVAVSSAAQSSSPPASSATSSGPVAVVPPPSGSPPAATTTAVPTTVTVTALPTSAVAVPPKSVTPATTAPPKTTPAKTTPVKTTPKPTPVANPLGVPQREIACSPGFVVQLASELDAAAFTAHVARLKASGQLPAGALAADSTKSCNIFTSQVNTLVLYSGPYVGMYDGCGARLTGPADAYIKGSNPGTAQQYISCLCPVKASDVPQYSQVGQQGVWVGEAQRVLGNKLNIDVSDLSGQWGIFTAGTKAAVQAFQKASKLPPSGNLDHRTWRAMQSAEC